MYQSYGPVGSPSLFSFGWFGAIGGVLLALIVIWSIIWKGLALWKSAREGSRVWFVVLLIVNTVGILDILYLYVFSKKSIAPVGETK